MVFHFHKLHGCGNSFIVLDDRKQRFAIKKPLIKKLCSAQFGIGSDGIILLQNSKRADFKMLYFNRDGSRSEMCGNGIRCLAKFVWDEAISSKQTLRFETAAGIIQTKLQGKRLATTCSVTVDMGEPQFRSNDFTAKKSNDFRIGKWRGNFISMGNPHAVVFVRNFNFDLEKEGRQVQEYKQLFPNQANVEFVKQLSKNHLRMRVWERGAGLTLACGTGACASVVAGIQKGLVSSSAVKVDLDGGSLTIKWDEKSNRVYMSGPAETVAQGYLIA